MVAGVNCYDWSSMGGQKRWLGQSALAFLAWARERLLAQEDAVLVECVMQFDHELLAELFDDLYELTVLRVSPSLFGLPVERQRKYMVLLAKHRVKWIKEVAEFGPEKAFHSIVAKKVVMSCRDHLRAPPAAIQAYIASLAEKRSMPETRRSGRKWNCFQVLTPALKASVRRHEQHLLKMKISLAVPLVVNLIQSPGFIKPVVGMIPALLRTSLLWSIPDRRLVIPQEYLELQGYQIFDNDEQQCPFLESFQELSDRKLRQFMGNAMHLRIVGSCLMFIHSATQRINSPSLMGGRPRRPDNSMMDV